MPGLIDHQDIAKHINVARYNTYMTECGKHQVFDTFCYKCYKDLGYAYGENTFEDQVIRLLLFKYYFAFAL